MKKIKLLSYLTIPTVIASSNIILASCGNNEDNPVQDEELGQLVILHTSSGICVDSLGNVDRTKVTKIVVPQEIDGQPVVEISKGAFKGCINLKSIELPFIGHTKTSTGAGGLFGYIFGEEMYEGAGAYTWQCYSTSDEYDAQPTDYVQFVIPHSLQSVKITGGSQICPGAFSNCSFIKEIEITDATTATEIGNYAFYYCSSLRNFVFPKSIKIIGRKSFQRCYNLKEINVPTGVTTIKHNAFSNCISAGKAFIPTTVKNMGKYVFENFINGLVLVEADEDQITTWDPEWININASIVYGYHGGSIYYTDTAQYAICKDSQGNDFAFVIQWTGTWESTHIIIPDTVTLGGTAYPVRRIGPNVFSENEYLERVTLGANVESLGANAFYACPKLETINFPDSMKVIGRDCFYGCNNLHQHVKYTEDGNETFEEGLDFNRVETIGANAFYGNQALCKISFATGSNASLVDIQESAFENCIHLIAYDGVTTAPKTQEDVVYGLVFPKTIQHIGTGAFRNCNRYYIRERKTVYTGIQFEENNDDVALEIDESAFENVGVRSITTDYPNYIYTNIDLGKRNIKAVKDNTFRECFMYRLDNIPQTIESIGNYSFYESKPRFTTPQNIFTPDYDDEREFQIPVTVKSIGNYAFYDCNQCRFKMTNITGTKQVALKTIGQHAFRYCSYSNSKVVEGETIQTGFTHITIPNTVDTIGTYAFQGCSQLRLVQLPLDNPKFTRIESATFSSCTYLGELSTHADLRGDDEDPIFIPATVTYIGGSAFSNCKYMRQITFAGDITYLGSSAFANDEYLSNNVQTYTDDHKGIWFMQGLDHCATFGSSIYQGCKLLQWLPMPQNTITSLPSYAFDGCEGIQTFVIPDGFTAIGESAFRNCVNMTTVTGNKIGSSEEYGPIQVKTIAQNSFYGCSGLTEIKLNAGINTFGENAFAYCTNLGINEEKKFILPENIIQAWTTASPKGMGKTPFTGWTEKQTIYFKQVNIESKSGDDLITRWGWTLKKEGDHYICPESGSSKVQFREYIEPEMIG